jgi:hypothetical protein
MSKPNVEIKVLIQKRRTRTGTMGGPLGTLEILVYLEQTKGVRSKVEEMKIGKGG